LVQLTQTLQTLQTLQTFQTIQTAKKMVYNLNGAEYIELIKLLKLLRIAESGGQAKMMVEEGEVTLNSVAESRKRAKLRPGDVVQIFGKRINIEP